MCEAGGAGKSASGSSKVSMCVKMTHRRMGEAGGGMTSGGRGAGEARGAGGGCLKVVRPVADRQEWKRRR